MKTDKDNAYKKLAQTFVSALICQTRLSVTLLVYAALALLLLTYVSAHVFASALVQDIAQLQVNRQQRKEALNKLTGEYVSASSRARVARYCESVLGMVQASDRSVERFAVRERPGAHDEAVTFAGRSPGSNELRFTLLEEAEKIADER
jgi:cell division protein FtsL